MLLLLYRLSSFPVALGAPASINERQTYSMLVAVYCCDQISDRKDLHEVTFILIQSIMEGRHGDKTALLVRT